MFFIQIIAREAENLKTQTAPSAGANQPSATEGLSVTRLPTT